MRAVLLLEPDREVRSEERGALGRIRKSGGQDRVEQRPLGLAEKDAEQGPVQSGSRAIAAQDIARRHRVVLRTHVAGGHEGIDAVEVLVERRLGSRHVQGDRQSLGGVIGEAQVRHLLGHFGEKGVSRFHILQCFGLEQDAHEDLDVDLVVGHVDAARVVDGVRVQKDAVPGEFEAGLLRKAQVAALRDDLRANLLGVHAHPVVGSVAHVLMLFGRGLHVRADAAVVEQVHGGSEDGADQFLARHGVRGFEAECFSHLCGDQDGLGAAVEDAAALADERRVVVAPGRSRQAEHAVALGEGRRRFRRGIDEDVSVVERGHELRDLAHQHAVAEDVARHIADAGGREGLGLAIDAEVREVVFDALPRSSRGDSDLLVVVAHRAAGGEGVSQPETVLTRNPVGGVGQMGGAFVRRDDEVRIVSIVADHIRRMQDHAVHDVVGHIEKARHVFAVAIDQIGIERGARGHIALEDEAAFRSDRNDDGVLRHLGLHETQNFAPIVVVPVAPTNAPARDFSTAEMNALNGSRVDRDLEHRLRRRNERNAPRLEFDRDHRALGLLESVGAEGCAHKAEKASEDLVVLKTRNGLQCRLDFLGLRLDHCVAAFGEHRVEPRREIPGDGGGGGGISQ